MDSLTRHVRENDRNIRRALSRTEIKKPKKKVRKSITKKPKTTKKKIPSSNSSPSDNTDFKKIVDVLSKFEPKNGFSNHTIKNMNEKSMEDKLYTGLSFLMAQNKLKTQVKKGKGIVDMAYKKIAIELKLNRRGVKSMLPRLTWQAKNYHKKYRKLLIYVVNHQKVSKETNAYVKKRIEEDFEDSKSIRKRDYKIIVKKV